MSIKLTKYESKIIDEALTLWIDSKCVGLETEAANVVCKLKDLSKYLKLSKAVKLLQKAKKKCFNQQPHEEKLEKAWLLIDSLLKEPRK